MEHNYPNQSDSQTGNHYQHRHYLYYLQVVGCHLKLCWVIKEFELVVFGVTFAVVTRHSASGHGVSVLSQVSVGVHLIPL